MLEPDRARPEQIINLAEQKNLLFLSLKEKTVKGILGEHVFDELPPEQVQRILAACFYGLEAGGTIAVSVFEGKDKIQRARESLADGFITLYPFTEKGICSLMEQTGFRISKVGRRNNAEAGLPELLIMATRV